MLFQKCKKRKEEKRRWWEGERGRLWWKKWNIILLLELYLQTTLNLLKTNLKILKTMLPLKKKAKWYVEEIASQVIDVMCFKVNY